MLLLSGRGVSSGSRGPSIDESLQLLRAFSFQDGGVGELEVHHEVAEGTVDVAAVALRRRVARRVDHVDAHALRVDDVVGLVQRPDLRVPRDHRVLPQVRARRLDPDSERGDSLCCPRCLPFRCQYFHPDDIFALDFMGIDPAKAIFLPSVSQRQSPLSSFILRHGQG